LQIFESGIVGFQFLRTTDRRRALPSFELVEAPLPFLLQAGRIQAEMPKSSGGVAFRGIEQFQQEMFDLDVVMLRARQSPAAASNDDGVAAFSFPTSPLRFAFIPPPLRRRPGISVFAAFDCTGLFQAPQLVAQTRHRQSAGTTRRLQFSS
jgi:hypothetical protein